MKNIFAITLNILGAALLISSVAGPAQATSGGRRLDVSNDTRGTYRPTSTSRVSSAPTLSANGGTGTILWAPKPSSAGTYFGKVIFTSTDSAYASYAAEIDETLTISTSGNCSAQYQTFFSAPGAFNSANIQSAGCQFASGSIWSFGN